MVVWIILNPVLTKPQLFARLSSVGLLPEGVNENDKDPDRYNFLKGIKDRTKKVEVRDLETGEITTYPSTPMYCLCYAVYIVNALTRARWFSDSAAAINFIQLTPGVTSRFY